jgi:hypothetical protein
MIPSMTVFPRTICHRCLPGNKWTVTLQIWHSARSSLLPDEGGPEAGNCVPTINVLKSELDKWVMVLGTTRIFLCGAAKNLIVNLQLNRLRLYLPISLVQWFSTFVRLQPGKFFFSIRTGPGIIDARARYQDAAWWFRNTALDDSLKTNTVTLFSDYRQVWIGSQILWTVTGHD